jgi:hypothetical protein
VIDVPSGGVSVPTDFGAGDGPVKFKVIRVSEVDVVIMPVSVPFEVTLL